MAKVRVHEVAKRYGISSKEVLDKFAAIGVLPRSASSVVDHADVHKFADTFGAQLLASGGQGNSTAITVSTPGSMDPVAARFEQGDEPSERVQHAISPGSIPIAMQTPRGEGWELGEGSERGDDRVAESLVAAPRGVRDSGRPRGRVFICFAEEHDRVAAELDLELRQRGLSTWLYHRDVMAGANYQVEASRAIRAAKAMIVLFSAETQSSRHCQSEVAIAFQAGVPTYPIRLDDTPLEEMEYALVLAQWKTNSSHVVQVLANQVQSSGGG